jgi:hypothetical protein
MKMIQTRYEHTFQPMDWNRIPDALSSCTEAARLTLNTLRDKPGSSIRVTGDDLGLTIPSATARLLETDDKYPLVAITDHVKDWVSGKLDIAVVAPTLEDDNEVGAYDRFETCFLYVPGRRLQVGRSVHTILLSHVSTDEAVPFVTKGANRGKPKRGIERPVMEQSIDNVIGMLALARSVLTARRGVDLSAK